MGINTTEQCEEEGDLSVLKHGGGLVVFVCDLDDVTDNKDPIPAMMANVSCAISPRFRIGDVIEYCDCLNWLKVEVVGDLSDNMNVTYKLKVVEVFNSASTKRKGEVFVYDYAKGFGDGNLKRFGDEF